MYLEILPDLDKNGKRYALFADNASIHTSYLCSDTLAQKNVAMITSVTYSPRLNPTENFINANKCYYRQLRLDALINNSNTPPEQLLVIAA